MNNIRVWKYFSFLAFLIIHGSLFTFPLASAGNTVPVMLWLGESSNSLTNPLHKTTKNEFEEILYKRLGKKTPPLILFLKESLCVEDIKPHKNLQQLNNAGSLRYLTSVDSPLEVFENLKSYAVSHPSEVELDSVNEGQLAVLQISDLSSVPDIYSMLKESSPNLKAALTGRICSYTLHERSKRATNAKDESSIGNNTNSIMVFEKGLLFYAENPPTIKIDDEAPKQLDKPTSTVVETIDNGSNLKMSFPNGDDVVVRFINSRGYFMIDGVEYKTKDYERPLISTSDISFPVKYSYHCSSNNLLTFSNKSVNSQPKRISLAFSNIQVQMNATNATFSREVYDCVGIFSIPILAGIFVTAILGLIMIWALLMIMDINTNDRFDDPKGKTITITAQD